MMKIDQAIEYADAMQARALTAEARVAELEHVIRTGGAMYRAERAALGIPGGHDPDQAAPSVSDPPAVSGPLVKEGAPTFDSDDGNERKVGQRASEAETIREEIARLDAKARAILGRRTNEASHAAVGAGGDEQSLAERAYLAHEEWLRQAFPDEHPLPAEPWRDLDEREREVWRGTVMLVCQEAAAVQLRTETARSRKDDLDEQFRRGWFEGVDDAIEMVGDSNEGAGHRLRALRAGTPPTGGEGT